MENLLSIKDLTQAQFFELIELAQTIKNNPKDYNQVLAGQSIVTIYEKPSLRTRLSFDIGINKLGGHAVYIDQQNGAMGKRESVADFAKNISVWADCIVARTFAHSTIEELAANAKVPVVNSLSDLYHPCQGMADFLTLSEKFDDLSKVSLAYVGDGNNVTHSLMYAAAQAGCTMKVVCPKGHFPDAEITNEAQAIATKNGGSIELSTDLAVLNGVDAIYTDTWISMGDSTKLEDIAAKFMPYQVNQQLMDTTGAKYFMHCAPAHLEEEVTAQVFNGEQSLVLNQAENRMHAQNAILVKLLGNK
ncbi:ornithine carbamoyltransferase [Paraferrimonas sp. SM1919]|uniref:ornithine carbamoyltransferase n=1 Tax=Paraferrimonas sp. SM1919 TaxID=2662263 RepID=UPI0013D13956|nr:ornithine carbamoyltransferase [Paraferrimonas sp. SM1919]